MITSPGFDDAQRAYAAGWWQYDTIVLDSAQKSFPAGAYNDWQQIAPSVIRKDTYYHDFRAKFGVHHYMGIVAKPYGDIIFGVGLHLAAGREPPECAAVRDFHRLSRHLSRALAVSCRVPPIDQSGQDLIEVLSSMGQAAAIVDRLGRLLIVNSALSTLEGNGFSLSREGLRCARSVDQSALEGMIEGCLSPLRTRSGPDQIGIARRDGRPPLIVRAIPLRRSRDRRLVPPFDRAGHVLLLVMDPQQSRLHPTGHALRLLGLTGAEARVAALVGAGHSPAEAARTLGVAEDTARKHVKAIFQKLGLSRQSELAVLVTRLSASHQAEEQ